MQRWSSRSCWLKATSVNNSLAQMQYFSLPGPPSWQSVHRLTLERGQLPPFLAGPLGAGGSLRVDLCSSSRTQEGGDHQAAASLEQSQKLQIPVASPWGLIWRPVGIYSICPHIAWEVGAPGGMVGVVLAPDPSAGPFSVCSPVFCISSLFCEHKACQPADFQECSNSFTFLRLPIIA